MWVAISYFISKAIIYHILKLRLELPAYTQYKSLKSCFLGFLFHFGLKINTEHEQHSKQNSDLPICTTKVRLFQANLDYITKPYLVTRPCLNKIKIKLSILI